MNDEIIVVDKPIIDGYRTATESSESALAASAVIYSITLESGAVITSPSQFRDAAFAPKMFR